MKYLIFDGLELAETRNGLCFAAGMETDLFQAGTTAYAQVRERPDGQKWALPIDTKYNALFTDAELAAAENLGAEWFPNFPDTGIDYTLNDKQNAKEKTDRNANQGGKKGR